MGWETRANGQYYYSKTWVNGTCISQYVGSGPVAEAIGQLARLDQQRRKFERDVRQAEQAETLALDNQVDEFCAVVGRIVNAVLLATGHHLHKREWRKRRMTKDLPPRAEVESALLRVQNDKATKADKVLIKDFVDKSPYGWELAGDMYRNAVMSTLRTMAGKTSSGWLLGTCLEKRLDEMKADFGYHTGSPIERLLIEQIVICWLRVYWLENVFSQNIPTMSVAMEWHYEKRLTLTHRRFNRAVETLARVRRLASRTPEILQVNIAQQQVNQAVG